jgi:uncharacterized protein YbbK (DUF523 family)
VQDSVALRLQSLVRGCPPARAYSIVMLKILVSACLAGHPVRYNGTAKTTRDAWLARWRDEGRLVIVCPEVAAGFPTPRPPAEIQLRRSGADVLNQQASIDDNTGANVTALFIAGAQHELERAKAEACRYALLADGSPSCGSTFIYDGEFSGTRHAASGVTATLLQQHGIHVFAESQIVDLAAALALVD